MATTEPLKTYLNRCRCCLEPFDAGEEPSEITDFFEIQFFAFTKVELKQHELLSKFVCEYCHMELVRFSVWKKDLILKQQKLYKSLHQQEGENELENFSSSDVSDGEIHEISDEELSIQNGVSTSDEISTEYENGNDDIMEEDEDAYTSAHEYDEDFELRKRKTAPSTNSALKSNDLRCPKCKSTFLAKKGLVRHVQFCKENGSQATQKRKRKKNKTTGRYRCFCDERFISRRALNIHRTRSHGKDTNMSWDIVSDDDDADEEEENGVIEKLASKKSTSKNIPLDITPIIVKSTPTAPKARSNPLKCPYCDFTSIDNVLLFNHMRKNHEETIKKPECIECNKTFSCTYSLKVHINTIHLSIRPHVCIYCKLNFKQLVHLKEHMLSIHKALHKPYCCSCGVAFSTLKELKLHKVHDHKGEEKGDLIKSTSYGDSIKKAKNGSYVCICGQEFLYPSRVYEHYRYCKKYKETRGSETHKIYKCFRCRRTFLSRTNLMRHQKCSGHMDSK